MAEEEIGFLQKKLSGDFICRKTAIKINLICFIIKGYIGTMGSYQRHCQSDREVKTETDQGVLRGGTEDHSYCKYLLG